MLMLDTAMKGNLPSASQGGTDGPQDRGGSTAGGAPPPQRPPGRSVPWYYQRWAVVLALLLIFPVGLVLLGKSPVMRMPGRIIWTALDRPGAAHPVRRRGRLGSAVGGGDAVPSAHLC